MIRAVYSPSFVLETPPSPPMIFAVSVEEGYRVIPRNLISDFNETVSSSSVTASPMITPPVSPSSLLETPKLLSPFNGSGSSSSSDGSFSYQKRKKFIDSVIKKSRLVIQKLRARGPNLELIRKRKIQILMSMRYRFAVCQ